MHITVVTPTHDPKYLPEIWQCLERQTLEHRWEWLIAPTRDARMKMEGAAFAFVKSPRVRVVPYLGLPGNVGAAKLWAFSRACEEGGSEQVLVELDHDDLLHPRALELVEQAFADQEVGFVYSDAIDWSPRGQLVTYHHPERGAAWQKDGWRFSTTVPVTAPTGPRHIEPMNYPHDFPLSFEPSALACSSVSTAPNHLRAWRSNVYRAIGGHDPSRKICDDLDLITRTYLATKMKRIPEPLYYYRVDGDNTWLKNIGTIAQASSEIQRERLHAMVEREMKLRGLPCLDLGGAIDPAPHPWVPVDVRFNDHPLDMTGSRKAFVTDFDGGRIVADLTKYPWPFDDSRVGAFRAFDFLEHLPNKLETMREIYRCLAPGGWLLSRTPSCAGPGAYRDPTHCSLWVKDSFRYHTERELARYLPDASSVENPRFMPVVLEEDASELPYIRADLVSLKHDDGSLPGHRGI